MSSPKASASTGMGILRRSLRDSARLLIGVAPVNVPGLIIAPDPAIHQAGSAPTADAAQKRQRPAQRARNSGTALSLAFGTTGR